MISTHCTVKSLLKPFRQISRGELSANGTLAGSYTTHFPFARNQGYTVRPWATLSRSLHPTMSSRPPDKYVRPRLHITVPYWLNDPCAPGYDPSTGLYHLFYQCNPFSTEWGNMSWGHATSKDLLRWTFMPHQPALAPDMEYDRAGVFTGGMLPVGNNKKLHVFYSSICRLPFHWHTPPYPRNSAGLAMASSEDDGKTWKKSNMNPILVGEPEGIEVSGYRDPYISTWKTMDELRQSEPHYYGLVSGGLDAKGPTSFLYAIHPERLEEWQYLGPLVDLPLSWNPSTKWGGNFGINWECVNFLNLTVGPIGSEKAGVTQDFLILGAEGDTERPDIKNHKLPDGLPARTVRTQVWMQGTLEKIRSGEIRLRHNYSGLFDHGSYYAANSFVDPKTSRRIVHGWIPEEDCSAQHAANKGWNGCLALPREVFVLSLQNVVRALHTPLQDMTNIELVRSTKGTTVRTMGIRPLSELATLRDSALYTHEFQSFSLLSAGFTSRQLVETSTPTWELEATISVTRDCGTVGFYLKHSSDLSIHTELTCDLTQEQITLDRSKSISEPALLTQINTCSESGPFTLFTISDPKSGKERLEKLHIRIFSDGDALEVFVNDRFALATVVYTGAYDTCGGVTAFVSNPVHDTNGHEDTTIFEDVKFWDGLNSGKSLLDGWDHVEKTYREGPRTASCRIKP